MRKGHSLKTLEPCHQVINTLLPPNSDLTLISSLNEIALRDSNIPRTERWTNFSVIN